MEGWRKDARREPIIVDLDALVPKNHLLRKIEKVMDYEWLYELLEPYYCHGVCEGETRYALYTPPRLGRRHQIGQA